MIAKEFDASRARVEEAAKRKDEAGGENWGCKDDGCGNGEPARPREAMNGQQEEIAGDRTPVDGRVETSEAGRAVGRVSGKKDGYRDDRQAEDQRAGAPFESVPAMPEEKKERTEGGQREDGEEDRLHQLPYAAPNVA